MKKVFYLFNLVMVLILSGCAAETPLADHNADLQAKNFDQPPIGKSGIYIYRNTIFGAGLNKSLYIDGKVIGSSAPMTFFYKVVPAGNHKISTEVINGTKDLTITTKSGINYFIRQYIDVIGGSDIELVEQEKAKKSIKKLKLAITH